MLDKTLSRRQAMQGLLALATGLSLSWGLGRAASRLTDADLALLKIIDEGRNPKRCLPRYLSRIQVHRLYRERMSLGEIDGIPVETLDGHPNPHDYVNYYTLDYDTTHQLGIYRSGCFLPPKRMDGWIQDNLSADWCMNVIEPFEAVQNLVHF